MDATLLLAFTLLIGTGLWISESVLPLLGVRTAPNLAVVTAHRLSAYATLGLLAVKLALHGRWIAQALTPRRRAAAGAEQPREAPGQRRLSRRGFIALAGGALGGLALWGWLGWQKLPSRGELSQEDSSTAMPDATDTPAITAVAEPAVSSDAATPMGVAPTMTPERQVPTAVAELTIAPTGEALVRTRCPYGMVNDPYPGRCRRYVDRDGSGYCDLSESA